MYYVFCTELETVIEDCTSKFPLKPEYESNRQEEADYAKIVTISSDGKLARVGHTDSNEYVLCDTLTAAEKSTEKLGSSGPIVEQDTNTLKRDHFSLQYNSAGLKHFNERNEFDHEAPVKVYDEDEAPRISEQHGEAWRLQAVSFDLKTQLFRIFDKRKPAPVDFVLYQRDLGYVPLRLRACFDDPSRDVGTTVRSAWTFSPDGNLLAGRVTLDWKTHLVGIWCTKTGRNWSFKRVPTVPSDVRGIWVSFSLNGQTLFTKEASFTIECKRSAGSETISLSTKNQLSWIGDWVGWEDEEVLWIPPEYYISRVVGRTNPGVYVIGLVNDETGDVSFLHFNFEKL
jgi:hypothetical protein